MGDALFDQGDNQAVLEQASQEYAKAEHLARRLIELAPEDKRYQRDLAFILQKIGDVRQMIADWQSATAVYNEAVRIMQTLVASEPANTSWQQGLANATSRLGQALAGMGDFNSALDQYRAALDIRTRLVQSDPHDDLAQSNLATSSRDIARLYARRGEFDAALAQYQRAISIRERLLEKDPSNATWQISLAPLFSEVGDIFKRKGDFTGALEEYEKAYELRHQLAIKDPGNTGRQYSFGVASISIADLLVTMNQQLDRAVMLYREAIATLDSLRPRYDGLVFRCYNSIGNIFVSQQNFDGGLTEYRRALGIALGAIEAEPVNDKWRKNLSESIIKIGELLIAEGRMPEALQHYEDALKFAEQVASRHPDSAEWKDLVASLKAQVEALKSNR